MNTLKVLAVADPAVKVYVDPKYRIIENFEDQDVKVEFDIVSWEDYFPTMMKAFEGNADYDIVMVAGHLWLQDFVSKGYLAPLEYTDEDILPVIMEEMKCRGKVYLSPSFCDGHMIVYRKSYIEKVVDKQLEEVISPDHFIEIVKTVNESKEDMPPYATALKAHPSEIMLDALPYLRTSGYDLYEQQRDDILCNIDKMDKVLEKYISLKAYAKEDTNTYGNDEIKDAIAKKQVAIAVTWSGQLGVVMEDCIEKEDLGFATFDTAWNVTWSFAVTSTSKKKDIAAKFLAYLRSQEVDKIAGAYSGAPVRKSSYIAGLNEFPWYNVQLKMIQTCAKPLIDMDNAGEKNNYIYQAIYKAFVGEMPIKEALAEAKSKIDATHERS